MDLICSHRIKRDTVATRNIRTDLENLNVWLDRTDDNFVVFTDTTVLYGLHDRVSPQPWLYFMKDHSFLMSKFARVDTALVESLIKNKVRVIVREKISWGEDIKVLEAMPALQTWIRNNFTPTKDFGIYEVLTMQTPN